MSKDAAKRAVALIAAAWPRQEFPQPSQRLYVEMLADIDDSLLLAAVQDLISKSTFLPAIAEVRQAAHALIELASGRLDSYSAWQQVTREIVRVGSYGTPDLDEMTARAVASIGGWRAICLSETAAADRARFVAAYDTFLARERDTGRSLPGVRALVDGMSAVRQLRDGREA